jgi:hypothetical protein
VPWRYFQQCMTSFQWWIPGSLLKLERMDTAGAKLGQVRQER